MRIYWDGPMECGCIDFEASILGLLAWETDHLKHIECKTDTARIIALREMVTHALKWMNSVASTVTGMDEEKTEGEKLLDDILSITLLYHDDYKLSDTMQFHDFENIPTLLERLNTIDVPDYSMMVKTLNIPE